MSGCKGSNSGCVPQISINAVVVDASTGITRNVKVPVSKNYTKSTECSQVFDITFDPAFLQVISDAVATANPNLLIPEPILEILNPQSAHTEGEMIAPQITARWNQTANNLWLNYKPEIWLFKFDTRKRRKRRDGGAGTPFVRKKGFVHPSHQNGIKYPGSAFYSGVQYSTAPNTPMAGKNTEYACPLLPRQRFVLNMRVSDFYRTVPYNTTKANYFGTVVGSVLPRSGDEDSQRQRQFFKFAIAIDNPAYNADPLLGDPFAAPKLFGPFSETLVSRPSFVEGLFKGYLLALQGPKY